ncbi:MAG: DUF3467 domain-containing protein [candidate division NC10 bacterium]|nr:DUF3467 domain-containing protein [candidate division NC10 bacterium]
MSNGPQEKPVQSAQIQIELDELVAQGIYANLAIITHSEAEFVLDFIYVQPQQPKARLRARVITSPSHTKRLLVALQENIKNYEQRFGPIEVAKEPVAQIGGYL